MFNPDAKAPKFAPTTFNLDDFWFSAYRGLSIYESKLHIEIEKETGEWYVDGLEISDGQDWHVVDKNDWLFKALDFELRREENVDIADRISEACLEAGEGGI